MLPTARCSARRTTARKGTGDSLNYYSTEDEVLMCDTNGVSHHPIQRKWAWYNQERIKGVKPFEQFVGLDLGINEGG